ncbi:hypothetical protein [Nitratidesulfovibrio sp. SRB-5]|uniref:hypothetical protein n=1 Tax=Nitratidesulfovibrio sp. SRB-5 TaxID=2872636 RepID=UPI00102597E7|nr:hypothetical protein [Nitratidesulfovibrio sp. SRB-5]MBZ2171569.1 hypothetical protein [Nitratidesulfovibrio sp. SRB-5]RXF76180.1 hypothetical protein EKK70_13115 [Desulfovibrio sp. DS-1]
MKPLSLLHDSRINAINILSEMHVGEYAAIAKDILSKNVFQRRRVGSSKTIYSLLKNDILKECVIPPVVLALTSSSSEFDADNLDSFPEFLQSNKQHLVILDGLQRSHTIIDLLSDLEKHNDIETLSRVQEQKIRVEFYVGLNRIGILYRMLTLNTGQTPMSLRHQIEMLYTDYLDAEIDGIQIIRESDNLPTTQINQLHFKDVVEGFNSYLDRDELPIEKSDILENIKSLEMLSKENQSTDLFNAYVRTWMTFMLKMHDLCGDTKLDKEYLEKNNTPFGKNALQLFKKPQAMSGFGAAIGKMVDHGVIKGFDDINAIIKDTRITSPTDFLEAANDSLEWIKVHTKKIGNAQRSYFHYFFRDLFNKDSDSFQNPLTAASSALRKYQSQNF